MDENVREADTVCGPFQHDVSAGPRTGQERASSSPVERLAWRPNNSQEETNPQKDGHLYVIFLYVFFFFFFFLSIYLYAPPRRMRTGSSSTLLNIFGRLNKRKRRRNSRYITRWRNDLTWRNGKLTVKCPPPCAAHLSICCTLSAWRGRRLEKAVRWRRCLMDYALARAVYIYRLPVSPITHLFPLFSSFPV